MEWWAQFATALAAFLGIVAGIGKYLHRNIMKGITSEFAVLRRDISKVEIEERGSRLRNHALSDVLQESFLNRDLAKELHKQVSNIDQQVTQEIEEIEKEYQHKLNSNNKK